MLEFLYKILKHGNRKHIAIYNMDFGRHLIEINFSKN